MADGDGTCMAPTLHFKEAMAASVGGSLIDVPAGAHITLVAMGKTRAAKSAMVMRRAPEAFYKRLTATDAARHNIVLPYTTDNATIIYTVAPAMSARRLIEDPQG